jgi:hypothetical protein
MVLRLSIILIYGYEGDDYNKLPSILMKFQGKKNTKKSYHISSRYEF